MDSHFSIGQAGKILGVSVATLRRWDAVSYLTPAFRTAGGHRRYSFQQLDEICGSSGRAPAVTKKIACYARVSSHDQKEDLKRQIADLEAACRKMPGEYQVISDLGSGMNFTKPGLKKLLQMILRRELSAVVLTHKDRLLRFGSSLIFQICHYCGTEVIVLEEEQKVDFNQQLTADLIEIVTVFTAKLYGKRAGEKRKRREEGLAA